MISYRKVGGMRFLRIGRLQVSWCVCRADKVAAQAEREERVAKRKEARHMAAVNRRLARRHAPYYAAH